MTPPPASPTASLPGLILAAPGATPAEAQEAPVERPSRTDPYGAFIAEAAQRFGVPEAWIRAVMRAESAGDVRAISHVDCREVARSQGHVEMVHLGFA